MYVDADVRGGAGGVGGEGVRVGLSLITTPPLTSILLLKNIFIIIIIAIFSTLISIIALNQVGSVQCSVIDLRINESQRLPSCTHFIYSSPRNKKI